VATAANGTRPNLCTSRYCGAAAARRPDAGPALVRELELSYDPAPRGAGLEERIRIAVLEELPVPFAFAELAARFGETPPARLRRELERLRREGRIMRTGTGRGVRWTRCP
jgi:hypothetical protein